MAYQIVFSPEALAQFTENCNYLEANFTENVLADFLQLVDTKLNLLANYPLLYPIYAKSKNIRRCVINKQISFFYKVNKRLQEIQIVSVFGNRQNIEDLNI